MPQRDPEKTSIKIWAENWHIVQLYLCVQTQWIVSMAGATGLNYQAVEVVMRIQNIPRKKRAELFAGLQVMEREILKVWAEDRE